MAAAARRCDSAASASWSWRLMPNLAATFSAVTPMCMRPNGSDSAPVIMYSMTLSPMRAPQLCDGTM
ncbi:hypothetical protein G6F40_017828 [Rhizopus arrhizus]|nr:hypothetical protein G6F40_017828 [Rhizopus arrhizus]